MFAFKISRYQDNETVKPTIDKQSYLTNHLLLIVRKCKIQYNKNVTIVYISQERADSVFTKVFSVRYLKKKIGKGKRRRRRSSSISKLSVRNTTFAL